MANETSRGLALITSGGSGSGRGFAREMSTLNHIVIVSDVNKNSAISVAKEISAAGGVMASSSKDNG